MSFTMDKSRENFAGVQVLVIVSYASGMPGFSPSEWISDKLNVLDANGQRAVLITSSASNLVSSDKLQVIKVPSLSWRDFVIEHPQLPRNIRGTKLHLLLHFLIAASLGRVFDWVFRIVAGEDSDGRWSWTLTAAPVILYQAIREPSSKIFASGGPSSAHLASVLSGLLSRRKVVLEFQDPFVGSEMLLRSRVLSFLVWLEKLLIRSSTKTVFVTKAAASAASLRSPALEGRVAALYPGSWKLVSQKGYEPSPLMTINFVHLGTLYGSRDLDTLLEAFEDLRREAPNGFVPITVNNMGAVYLAQRGQYLKKPYFFETPLLPRKDALELAKEADCLLLVQHGDSRSEETIPYKFYDYLNLGIPIFGLVRNPELADILESCGAYVCKQGNLESTKNALLGLMKDFKSGTQSKPMLEINIMKQFSKALHLDK